MKEIVLASASPRRKQLLEWAEVPFTVTVSGADESYPAHLGPKQVAEHIAVQKALAVQKKSTENAIIIAADTIVVLGDEIIGKPESRKEALSILKKLSGQMHKVITGVSILQGENQEVFSDETEVHFHALTEEQILFYVDKYQPFDKAGAYAIQEWIGVIGIKSINGDFYNVMGLPVSRVVQALHKFLR